MKNEEERQGTKLVKAFEFNKKSHFYILESFFYLQRKERRKEVRSRTKPVKAFEFNKIQLFKSLFWIIYCLQGKIKEERKEEERDREVIQQESAPFVWGVNFRCGKKYQIHIGTSTSSGCTRFQKHHLLINGRKKRRKQKKEFAPFISSCNYIINRNTSSLLRLYRRRQVLISNLHRNITQLETVFLLIVISFFFTS